MNRILHIDTAQEKAIIALSEDGKLIAESTNEKFADHAKWLHEEIMILLKKNHTGLKDLAAVSVALGPGSYTGLRIGLSAAKGFCYALNLPLIGISSLQLVAASIKITDDVELICPMIDARRNEVFTATYDKLLNETEPPSAKVAEKESFVTCLSGRNAVFTGNGSKKLYDLVNENEREFFRDAEVTAHQHVMLGWRKFLDREFVDIAYAEPIYVKEFYSPNVGKTAS